MMKAHTFLTMKLLGIMKIIPALQMMMISSGTMQLNDNVGKRALKVVSRQKIKMRTSQMLQCLSSLKITEASEAIYVYTCHQWHTSGYVIIGTLALVALLLYLIVPISLAVLYIKNQQGKSRTCFVYSSKGSDSQSLTYQINGTKQSKKQIIVKVCYL